jgi:hypothetical protein
MMEQEPRKETLGRGELFFLCHPGTSDVCSGYGLTVEPGRADILVGLLMIDRPTPADPEWLRQVEDAFRDVQLVEMTAAGERGIACQMQIEPESLHHLRQLPGERAVAIQNTLEPFLDKPPNPIFSLHWDEASRLWRSEFAPSTELPFEIREVFVRFGYGCLTAETSAGAVHICHASDADIKGFADKPVLYQWQLIQMSTAPLIRLELVILDHPSSPYKFESFLNVAEENQLQVLSQLANQGQLYLAFYGDDLTHRFTKIIAHDRQQWQYLDELVGQATRYWQQLPREQQDFDRAKAEFMSKFV